MRTKWIDIIRSGAAGIADVLIDIRRQIHRHPELGFEEMATADLICNHLETLKIPFRVGVGKTGVVGLITGRDQGKTIGLRADMDALPVQEKNDTPYVSQKPGVMHACGHDAHVSCLLGAAMLLAPLREEITGNIKLIFQPAEEIDLGAKAILADGGLENPRPNALFALHVDPELEIGNVGLKNGPLMAALDSIKISVRGKGGHGALPHTSVDTIVAASAMVMNLQTAVSRETDPMKPAVISIGTFNSGHTDNIIASRADLTGTVRTLDPDTHREMPAIIKRICKSTAASFGAEVDLGYQRMIPPLVNTPEMTDRVKAACRAILGADSIKEAPVSMLGDDFSFFLKDIPGCYFRLGVKKPDGDTAPSLHNEGFDIDERSLSIGASILAYTALLNL
jgi:amidohydrolase